MGLAWRAKLKKWRNDGCPNVLHHCSFIDAEFEATKGNISAAIKHFETAVLMSARGGLLLDAALVSERFGELYLENGDNENAPFRFGQAIQYYKDSDAYGKVDDMEGKYAELMPKPKEIVLS